MEDKLNNAAETVGEVSFKFKLKNNKFLTYTIIILLALGVYYLLFPKWDFITVPQQPGMPIGSIAQGIVKVNKISGRVYGWAGDAGWKPLEKDKYPK
jgi:cytochrome c-type biogenesis protein CcmH/NrfG